MQESVHEIASQDSWLRDDILKRYLQVLGKPRQHFKRTFSLAGFQL
jgi:hypothetical protein